MENGGARLIKKKRGNCYVTSEALFHLLGGKKAGWKPMRVECSGDMHWFLEHQTYHRRLDVTLKQFNNKPKPKYNNAVGCGFLTKQPSKRAKKLMNQMLWQA